MSKGSEVIFSAKNNSNYKSDRENIILEKIEGESKEKYKKNEYNIDNEIIYISKKNKDNNNKKTLKNELKKDNTGNKHLYKGKKYFKNSSINRKINQINNTNDSIKNSKIFKISKIHLTTDDKETIKTESMINNNKIKNGNEGNMRLKNKNVNFAYTDEELNEMKFDEAFHNDKRPFLRIYWSYLLANHIILNTFFADSYLDLRIIKISFLIYTFEISFFLNAFFYTDEYISSTYHNDGVLDFFSSLPKSIYSMIVTMIGGNLLKMLSSSKSQLMKILKERNNKLEYLYLMKKELRKLRNKLIIYFIFVFILGLFFLYYISAFCAVYQNSQLFWFYGCLESLAMDISLPFIICLLFAILRFLALKKHLKMVYILAKFLNIIL